MFENWFIKNKKLLEENSRTENLIDLSSEIDKFSIILDSIEFPSIFWFIGKFWIWKSNFLNQIKNSYKKILNGLNLMLGNIQIELIYGKVLY